MEDLLQTITIYHLQDKKWKRYIVQNASVRNTSIINRNKTGLSNVDNALIRIFDIDKYGVNYCVSKDDVIVNKPVNDEIIFSPLNELRNKYGKENVYQVKSIDVFKFNDKETKDFQHIKIGAI